MAIRSARSSPAEAPVAARAASAPHTACRPAEARAAPPLVAVTDRRTAAREAAMKRNETLATLYAHQINGSTAAMEGRTRVRKPRTACRAPRGESVVVR